MSDPHISRRRFLGASGAAAASLASGLLPTSPREAASAESSPATGFRFVHLTDIHVQPELRAAEGLTACLKSVASLDPKPDFILTGGDLVMDTLEQDAARSKMLFVLYKRVLADWAPVPVHQCIGNHNVFGWGRRKGVTPQTPGYGKKMVCDVLGLERTYYRFDHKGWRFFVLDDIQESPHNLYQAYIDEEQRAWLEKELAAKPAEMPAAAVCHIPILSVTVFGKASDGAYTVETSAMCRDARDLNALFAKHNVRLVLTGHLHQQDRVEFQGVVHVCEAAVSGAWWKGPHKGFEEGFGVVDLGPDGTIRNAYHDYGWNVSGT